MRDSIVNGTMIYVKVSAIPRSKVTATFLPAETGGASPVCAIIDMTAADALALAEALEEVVRPMIEGGPATFRDAMESALGDGE